MEKQNKLQRVENLIDYILGQNFCENDTKTYLHYLDKDLENLQELKENSKTNEQECLADHCIEEIILLQEIIEIIKGVEE